ncbi:uncharacterized protein [Diabrotica undecimpunctata]|uniref:uncharacterized protein n=1 Tax=Diabrotica undecimpunctata TaxID=50387 RepID=UPI003B63F4C8
MMDIEELITKVQVNAPIWNKKLKHHSNRNIVDACWRKISSEMKIDEVALRKKWKYLRDQFSVEWSKTKLRSEDAAEPAEPKWPYFKNMIFLKDIVTTRASSRYLRAAEIEQEHSRDDEAETDTTGLNEGERESPNDEDATETQFDQPRILSASQSKRRRMMATNTLYNQQILQLEQQKINTIQNNFQREPDNDDLLFFKSLLPFVSKIPIEQKLRFRNHIQQVVEHYAFMGIALQPPSAGLLTIASSHASPASSTTSYASRKSPDQDCLQILLTTGEEALPQNKE